MRERILSICEALREALIQEMVRNKQVILIGQDIGTFGGPFQVTRGLLDRFGSDRIRETPISEAAMIGAGVGAAAMGLCPVVELMFSDFVTCGMDQVVNQAAKLHLMTGGQIKVPMVLRLPTGTTQHGAQHAQCLEAWFLHVPGLKVIAPGNSYDAKGLLISAIRDDNPVLVFEHKLLYGSKPVGGKRVTPADSLSTIAVPVPEEPYTVPIGKAIIRRSGKDVTFVCTQLWMHKALLIADELKDNGMEAEVIDLRSIVPLDMELIAESVRKTGRCIVAIEECISGGVGAEIVARVQKECFDYLDAPVERLALPDMPIPFVPSLQKDIVPTDEVWISLVCDMLGGVCRQ